MRALALVGARKRDAALARVQHAGEHVDRPALAGSVTALEQNNHSLLGLGYPARHRAQLLAQRLQELLIFLSGNALAFAHISPLTNGTSVARRGAYWNLRRSG